MEMDSAPSQSKHLQEGSEGSTPMNQDRRMMGSRDVEAVMFVPHTPGEELRKRLQAKQDELSKMFGRPRIKVIKRAGTVLENLLCSKNPWSQMACGRPNCHVCQAGSGNLGQCRKEGVIYSLTCLNCATKGVRKLYWGETGRGAF